MLVILRGSSIVVLEKEIKSNSTLAQLFIFFFLSWNKAPSFLLFFRWMINELSVIESNSLFLYIMMKCRRAHRSLPDLGNIRIV